MGTLYISDVPDEVRLQLVVLASACGQTLSQYLREYLLELAGRGRGAQLLDRFEDRADGSRLSAEEHAEEVQRFRAERDSRG
jgi:hypothetical protein